MFCEECGSPLKEGDKLCSVCGVGAVEAADSIHDHQDETQPGGEEMYQRDADSEKGPGVAATDGTNLQTEFDGLDVQTEPDKTEIDRAEFRWDLEGFPVPKKTEDINFNWDVEGSKALADEIVISADSTGTGSDADSLQDFAENLDKYFNFEKGSEEFQALLDQEYEEIKDYSHPVENHYIERMNFANRIGLTAELPSLSETRRKTEAEAQPQEATEDKSETEAWLQEETEAGTEIETREEYTSEAELQAEIETELDSETGTDPEGGTETGPQPDLEIEADAAEGPAEPESMAQGLHVIESDINASDNEEEEEPEVIWITDTGDSREDSSDALNEEQGAAPLISEIPQEEPKISEASETAAAEPEQSSESGTEISSAQEQPDTPREKEAGELEPLWFEANEEEVEVERSGCVGRTILILIIAVLLAEVALLGVQYFFKDSNAAKKAGEINEAVSGTLVEWKDRAVDFFKGIGGDETGSSGIDEPPANIDPDTGLPVDGEDPESQPGEAEEPDPVPVADKAILIAAAADLNKNIAEVKANSALTWQAGKTYKIADIKNSKPIENNHWVTKPSGEHVYYDKEIVATMMDFDSKWNDYVNGGSDAVINLTKEGSQARRNVETFSKVGKVNQTFLLLEIGEIRKSDKAFYAWAYEEIEEAEGSKTTTKKYKWVYQLEPVGDEMKIVNYCSY